MYTGDCIFVYLTEMVFVLFVFREMKKLEKTASELRDQLEDEQYFSVRSHL